MPDPFRILAAAGVAAALAAAALLLSRGRLAAVGRLVGVALGIYAGALVLGLPIHWPPREDLDRLLVIVLPAALLTELVALGQRTPRGLVRALRLLVAAGTARVLLAGTAYISHAAGPDSRLWSASEVWCVLGGLAFGLALLWWALVALVPTSTMGRWWRVWRSPAAGPG